MKTLGIGYLIVGFFVGVNYCAASDQSAQVTQVVNKVEHGSSGDFTLAKEGTSVRNGDVIRTLDRSLAEIKLPSTSITRLGANTTYNYSVDSNTVDLQAGTILFCKPKHAENLNIKTAAVTAGIVGTTGFVSIQGQGSKKTYIFGIIEGHAVAHADNHPFIVGPGDILEFKPGARPFLFAYDVPRFVKSTTLIKKFHSTLPNQTAIDAELAEYADDVSRGFITPPSKTIDYTGDIPVLSAVAYSSAQNAQGQPKTTNPQPPPPAQTYTPGGYNPNGSSFH